MTRPQSGDIVMHGIVKDKSPSVVDADKWSDGRNVYFRVGKTWRMIATQPYANAGRLFAAQFVRYVELPNGQQFWLYGGDAGIAVTDGTTHYDITPASGWGAILTTNLVYTVGDLNGVPFVNHPERGPIWWDGVPTHPMTALTGWPAGQTCACMRAHKNFLMALNINLPSGVGRLSSQVMWSSSAPSGQIPGSWTPSPTNDAGDADFSETRGQLFDGISVRDQFFVMKSHYTGMLQYIGGQFVFQQRDIFPSLGIFATGCCVEDANMVYMFTGDRQMVRHDGSSYANLLYGVLERYISTQFNFNNPEGAFVYRNAPLGQVCLAYPVGTSNACTEAVMMETASGDASIIDLPSVWMADTGLTAIVAQDWNSDPQAWNNDITTWNEMATGVLPATLTYAAGSAGLLSENGLPSNPAFVQRSGIDLDKLDSHKVLSGIRPLMEGSTGDHVTFNIGSQEVDSDPLVFGVSQDFVLGVDNKVDFFNDGRLLAINITGTSGSFWQITKLAPQARLGGRY
jgi:hypothetical protein